MNSLLVANAPANQVVGLRVKSLWLLPWSGDPSINEWVAFVFMSPWIAPPIH